MFREDTVRNTLILLVIAGIIASPGIALVLSGEKHPQLIAPGFGYLLCCIYFANKFAPPVEPRREKTN